MGVEAALLEVVVEELAEVADALLDSVTVTVTVVVADPCDLLLDFVFPDFVAL